MQCIDYTMLIQNKISSQNSMSYSLLRENFIYFGCCFKNEIRFAHEFRPSLKVSKFQNEFMKSSFLPTYEPKISALYCATLQGRNPYNIWFIFWEK